MFNLSPFVALKQRCNNLDRYKILHEFSQLILLSPKVSQDFKKLKDCFSWKLFNKTQSKGKLIF